MDWLEVANDTEPAGRQSRRAPARFARAAVTVGAAAHERPNERQQPPWPPQVSGHGRPDPAHGGSPKRTAAPVAAGVVRRRPGRLADRRIRRWRAPGLDLHPNGAPRAGVDRTARPRRRAGDAPAARRRRPCAGMAAHHRRPAPLRQVPTQDRPGVPGDPTHPGVTAQTVTRRIEPGYEAARSSPSDDAQAVVTRSVKNMAV